jgi:hypothetical protein
MFFDRKLLEEQVALKRIHHIQKLAWDALEAGLDGPAIRRLAALEKPSSLEWMLYFQEHCRKRIRKDYKS